MKPSEPSRQRTAWRSGDQAGRNASETGARLETNAVGTDPPTTRGRLPSLVELGPWFKVSFERGDQQPGDWREP
jgi:hypothetical protein